MRETVAAIHPDVVELASVRERSVWWGWAAAKMKQGYAYAIPHRAHVNLGIRKTARNFNRSPQCAARNCVAEEIAPRGSFDPDCIHLPGAHVHRPMQDQRELRTVRTA